MKPSLMAFGVAGSCLLCASIFTSCAGTRTGEETIPPPVYAQRGWSTVALGGTLPTVPQLVDMQKGNYVLRGRDGRIEHVPVEKISLPQDPCGHVQRLSLFRGPDGAIYAGQCSVLSKSIDGGRTWTHVYRETPKGEVPDNDIMNVRVLRDGSWIKTSGDGEGAIAFSKSNDEGRSWQQGGSIHPIVSTKDFRLGTLEVLGDGSVVVATTAVYSTEGGEGLGAWKGVVSLFHRSYDGGKTFTDPTIIGEWGHEINLAELPSGKLLAVIRYQRPPLPSDPPGVMVATAAKRHGHGFPYKHVFVADSEDGGKTWSPIRQVTTECGQCHGAAVGLTDGRVVMIYDHRYPRPTSSARAVVSDDEGKTWRDEVYYLSNGIVAGFSRSLSLDGNEILTLTGSYYGEKVGWDDSSGNTQFAIIRWKLAED